MSADRISAERARVPRGREGRLPSWAVEAGLVLLAVALFVIEIRPVFSDVELVLGPYREPDTGAVLLFAFIAVPLGVRRRFPLTVAGIVMTAAFAFRAAGYPPLAAVDLAAMVAIYSVGAYRAWPGRTLSLAGIALWLLAGQAASPVPLELSTYIVLLVVFGGASTLGRLQRTQREQSAALADRAALLERERESRAARAVAEERARIARELHDVVAHHVSVVVIQAEGAAAAFDRDPGAARSALASIQSTGRMALAEMRRLLGVLRDADPGGGEDHQPQPSVERLDGLIEDLRKSGLAVELAVEELDEGRVPLPEGVGVSAYRIVQEALTNTLRHAPGAKAHVRLVYEPAALDLEVLDDGAVDGGRALDGDGHGHVGIRERVSMLGGELELGPREGGGYRVHARIPLAQVEG